MVNSYNFTIIAKKIKYPPTPIPSPSIKPTPEPSIVPEPSIRPPTPIPSLQPAPVPSTHPEPPTPISSFDRENGINLDKDTSVSRIIKSGDSILYRISIRPNQQLSLSCSSLVGKSMNIFIGQDFKPTHQKFTLQMNSNQVRSVENRSAQSQVIFVMVEGPSAGSSQIVLLPSVEKVENPENSGLVRIQS